MKALIVSALSLSILSVLAAKAQSPNDIVGTWAIVSADTVRPDGSRTPNYGPNPEGIVMFDANGRYSFVLARSSLPKLASNNRMEGTADENKAIVQGSVAHFGRYVVNFTDKTITFQIETSTFPNWNGIGQKRPFTLGARELRYTVAAATGGGTAEVVLRRDSR